jgi:hypothetical protein
MIADLTGERALPARHVRIRTLIFASGEIKFYVPLEKFANARTPSPARETRALPERCRHAFADFGGNGITLPLCIR